jgi:transmembrane protein TMEM70 (proton-transport ATP synthase complex)
VVGCWVGWDLFQTYGIRPADGGQLASLPVRLAWGLGMAGLGLAFAAGMALYGTLYIGSIRYDEAAGTLHIRTVEFILTGRKRVVPLSAVKGARRKEGRLENPGGVSVDAPWLALQLKGRKWPLIVDAQGHFPDPELAARLLRLG